eukprot:4611570-Amphidinium_carterae.1
MLDAVTLGHLEAYRTHIKDYSMRHPSDWATIYLADVRCRSELMERTRQSLEEERAKAVQAGRHH